MAADKTSARKKKGRRQFMVVVQVAGVVCALTVVVARKFVVQKDMSSHFAAILASDLKPTQYFEYLARKRKRYLILKQ